MLWVGTFGAGCETRWQSMQPVGCGATTVVEPYTYELWKVPAENSVETAGSIARLATPFVWHGLHC